MIQIDKVKAFGWEEAIRGMRNPMNSWDKSDTKYYVSDCCIGRNDYNLMKTLSKAGTDHSKYLRMITVYADINAPLYWWKEYDTYKVGTVANSCSTMHKIHAKELTRDDFSHNKLNDKSLYVLDEVIRYINIVREYYLETKDKEHWEQMIQLLPSSYNQKRTVLLNYQVLKNMYHARKNHKLDEWRDFCKWVETLPYSELITDNE
jgi:hypothetical protein